MASKSMLLLALALCCVAATASAGARHRVAMEHPKARIALEEARMMMDSSASIKASPSVLGTKGEDTEYVTVEYSNANASSDDWIAVFSPADFNSSICPDTNKKEAAPFLCTAPIKFRLANASSDYVKTKSGSIKFQLINQRADFAFVLFAGGYSNPKLIQVSNKVSFANPKAPVFPRLAVGKAWNTMTVTWTSGYSVDQADAFVEWGVMWGPQTRSPAGTLTFKRGSLCGAPANTVGYRDPGFIHTGFMTGLWPSKTYTYKVGHQLPNGTVIYGKSYTFKSAPFPGQPSKTTAIIFGDMGKAERDGSDEYVNTQPGALNTTDALVKDLDNYDIVFHIGDITYANGYISEWDQFTAQIEPIAAKKPYMLASGNHERDWPSTGSQYDVKDSGGECGVLAETMFYVPAENRAKYWYTLDYGLFRFCIADTEHEWKKGSEQYKAIEHCLATADRKHQPWLIFIAHRVITYSSSSGYVNIGLSGEPTGREEFQPLWQKYRVDLTFVGHVHNYERTCLIYENNCVLAEDTNHYSGEWNGTIHIVAGTGGRAVEGTVNNTPVWSLHREVDYGFVKLTAFNQSSLQLDFIKSRDSKVYDSITIERKYKDVLSNVLDSTNTFLLGG